MKKGLAIVMSVAALLSSLAVGTAATTSKTTDGSITVSGISHQNDSVTAADIASRYNSSKNSYRGDTDAPTFDQLSLVKFTGLSSGKLGGMALDINGKVWSWGYNMAGRLGMSLQEIQQHYGGGIRRIPFFVNNNITVIQIEQAYETNYALDSEGNVYCWGRGYEGQMGNGRSGGGALSNPTPIRVDGLPKITSISPGKANQAHHIVVTDVNGDLWSWGYADGGRIPGQAGFVSRPVKLIAASKMDFVQIVTGDNHTLALDTVGDVWAWGWEGYGALGNGKTGGYVTVPTKISGLSNITEIDVNYSRNVALQSDGTVWQWGAIYGYLEIGTGQYTELTRPERLVMNPAEVSAVGYTPVGTKVIAGESISYFIDQHGRPWAWGSNRYFGLGKEGGYETANDIVTRTAVQYPKVIGDGDTQIYDQSTKLPIYATNNSSNLPAGFKFGYGFNELHPTVYDEKYMMKDSAGYVLDADGNRLQYQATNAGLRLKGYYYNIKTGKIGMPTISPSESAWADSALQEMPYLTDISTERSSTLFLDNKGNLFKTGYDGSGTVAWGWDYEEKYDLNGNLLNGLYDRYTYEVMYMRGVPGLPKGSINYTFSDKKIYKTAGYEPLKLKVTAVLPEGINDPNLNLNLNIKPVFDSLEYVSVPYDMANPDAVNVKPNDAEFDALLAKYGGRVLLDSSTHNGSASISAEVDVTDNCIVYVRSNFDIYGATTSTISAHIVDSFYTPIVVDHRGSGDASALSTPGGSTDMEVYPVVGEAGEQILNHRSTDNVLKTNDDVYKTIIGLPLDVNNNIISSRPDEKGGVKDNNAPTYGYDQASITSYDESRFRADGWELVNSTTQQVSGGVTSSSITLDANFVKGALDLTNFQYTHTFYYVANENLVTKADVIVDNDYDRFLAPVSVKSQSGKKSYVYIIRNHVGNPTDLIAASNVVYEGWTDNNGVLNSMDNAAFATALGTLYSCTGPLIQKPIEATTSTGQASNLPIYAIARDEGKFLSNVATDNVLPASEMQLTKLSVSSRIVDGSSKMTITTEATATVRIYVNNQEVTYTSDRNVYTISQTFATNDVVKVVAQAPGKKENTVSLTIQSVRRRP